MHALKVGVLEVDGRAWDRRIYILQTQRSRRRPILAIEASIRPFCAAFKVLERAALCDDIARGSISPLGRSVAPRSRPFAGTLIAGLAPEVLREDASFHAYQMLWAGIRQAAWGDTDQARHILIAVARYLAAHSPTERAALQTADIARRLMRDGRLHQE
jgi:hypothetical protein